MFLTIIFECFPPAIAVPYPPPFLYLSIYLPTCPPPFLYLSIYLSIYLSSSLSLSIYLSSIYPLSIYLSIHFFFLFSISFSLSFYLHLIYNLSGGFTGLFENRSDASGSWPFQRRCKYRVRLHTVILFCTISYHPILQYNIL